MYKKEDLLEKIWIVLNLKPYLTFEKICQEIQISRATAYKFFSDKEDLVSQIAWFYLDELNFKIDEIYNDKNSNNNDKLDNILKFKIGNLSKYKFLKNFLFVLDNGEILNKYNSWYEKIWYLLKELKNEKKLKDNLDIIWILYALDWLIQAWYYASLDDSFCISDIEKKIISDFYLLIFK